MLIIFHIDFFESDVGFQICFGTSCRTVDVRCSIGDVGDVAFPCFLLDEMFTKHYNGWNFKFGMDFRNWVQSGPDNNNFLGVANGL